MKQLFRRATALVLALLVTVSTAAASEAMGWQIHTGKTQLSQGTGLGKNLFWSDTYSDLRAEYYVEYTPNSAVLPTVSYGTQVLNKDTLTNMAAGLEAQGRHVVSGINGDWYVVSTGAPVGLVVTNGVVRVTPYYDNAWAVGFRSDGTAFIGQPKLYTTVSFGGQSYRLSGSINKIRKITAADTSGGLTLLTSDFSATTENTQPGVDVILAPVDDGSGYALEPRIGRQTRYVVEQVLESTKSIPIPAGKAVLTMNGKDNAEILAALRALKPGDPVMLTVATGDARWTEAVEALGGTHKIVHEGQVCAGLPTERTAWTAVGIRADGSVVLYTMDGRRSGHSVGATLSQIAQRLLELGCTDAIGMDGGGSTTLGAALPGQNAFQVVGKPSDGAQRANSTAIFLTTQLQPTGMLGSYYVTPGDSMLLAKAAVQLSASGLDSAYYPVAGNPVSWTVSSGGGSVDANGLFTAGTESGFTQVTASDGAAEGTAYITTVKTPDSITVTNQATGAAVTQLNLDPEQQVDLTASAVYRKLALTAQDACFTWGADPAVGTIDQNGLFTAGGEGARGSITVSAGERSVTIPVRVAGHVYQLEDCEGVPTFQGDVSAELTVETGLELVHSGSQSWRVAYDLPAGGTSTLAGSLSIAAGEKYLGLWVYGDGSGNALTATAVDVSLRPQSFALTELNFTGWKHICVPLPENTVSLTGIQIVRGSGNGGGAEGWMEHQSGVIWLDHFTTSNEDLQDTTAPTITIKTEGTQLTAAISDDVDRSFAQKQITVTYDGAPLAFTWNEAAGTLTAALPAAGERFHRVSVTAADASGNLGRASADLGSMGSRPALFADLAGSPYVRQASYLYDSGVTNGVPSANGLLFQPEKDITRAEFFALAARWLNLDLSQYAGVELPFADAAQVPGWALNEVKAMYALGLLKGAAAGDRLLVNAGATITRAEALTILGRTQPMGYGTGSFTAPDAAQVADWARVFVHNLWAQGVTGEKSANIRPQDLLTRGEMAQMLYNMH